MIEGNVILEHIFKDDFQGTKFWILVECNLSAALRIQVMMKRHPSLASIGYVDFGIFEENYISRSIMEKVKFYTYF